MQVCVQYRPRISLLSSVARTSGVKHNPINCILVFNHNRKRESIFTGRKWRKQMPPPETLKVSRLLSPAGRQIIKPAPTERPLDSSSEGEELDADLQQALREERENSAKVGKIKMKHKKRT